MIRYTLYIAAGGHGTARVLFLPPFDHALTGNGQSMFSLAFSISKQSQSHGRKGPPFKPAFFVHPSCAWKQTVAKAGIGCFVPRKLLLSSFPHLIHCAVSTIFLSQWGECRLVIQKQLSSLLPLGFLASPFYVLNLLLMNWNSVNKKINK